MSRDRTLDDPIWYGGSHVQAFNAIVALAGAFAEMLRGALAVLQFVFYTLGLRLGRAWASYHY